MKKLKKIIIFAAGALILALYLLNHKTSAHVHAVYDPTKVGEMNMIKALTEAITQVNANIKITENPNAKSAEIKIDSKHVNFIVTAGQSGVEFIKSSSGLPKNVKFLLCVHQWFDAMKDLHDISVAIPKHALNSEITSWAKKQNVELISTQGVLHRMSAAVISAEDTSIIHMKDAKVGLILGGDAEMPNGKDWKLFSEKNAHELGIQICEYLKKTGHKILITNGPRTGAFKDVHNRDPNAHKDGKIDRVSKAFLNTLEEAGFKQGEHFEFYDFQFGATSALKAVMAVVYKNKGFMIVPGESTSSISESIAIMPTIVCKVDSMNAVHESYLNDLDNSKLAILWPNIPDESKSSSYVAPESQALSVAKVLLSGVIS